MPMSASEIQKRIKAAHEGWFPSYMAGEIAA